MLPTPGSKPGLRRGMADMEMSGIEMADIEMFPFGFIVFVEMADIVMAAISG